MRRIDLKYSIENERIVKTKTGEPIPDDEPVILFRARDVLALPMLEYYMQLCRDHETSEDHLTKLECLIKKFEMFSNDASRVKLPG